MTQEYEFRLHVSGPNVSQVVTLAAGRAHVAGRQAGSDILLDHSLVSRRHAQIECTATDCHITDLGSANGTLVDGKKLRPQSPAALEQDSVIGIGPFTLTCERIALATPEPVAPQPAAPVPEPPAQPEPVEPSRASVIPIVTPPEPPPPYIAPPPAPQDDGTFPGSFVHGQRLLNYLPDAYHNDFMRRFLAIFESILSPIEWTVDNFDLYLDPNTSPAGFLPWLANWFQITFDATWSEAQRRTLLKEAYRIYARRGTRWALSRVLEIYTGHAPTIVDTEQDLEPFTFRVKLPLSGNAVNRDLVERLIDAHKPAHTTYTLEIA